MALRKPSRHSRHRLVQVHDPSRQNLPHRHDGRRHTGHGNLPDPYLLGFYAAFNAENEYQADGLVDDPGDRLRYVWRDWHTGRQYLNGNQYNDDGGDGRNARLFMRTGAITDLIDTLGFPAGVYYVAAKPLAENQNDLGNDATYQIVINEVDDQPASPVSINTFSGIATVTGYLDFPGDQDPFTIDLSAGKKLLVSTTGAAPIPSIEHLIPVTEPETSTPSTPSVVLSETSLTVAEGDATGRDYTVQLSHLPTQEVTVTVTGHADSDLTLTGLSDTDTLTFTTNTWNTPQTVTVQAGPDDDPDDDIHQLVHTAAGGEYDDVEKILPVTVTDDDAVIAPGLYRFRPQTAGVYNVIIATPPTDSHQDHGDGAYTVTIALDPDESNLTLGTPVDTWISGRGDKDVFIADLNKGSGTFQKYRIDILALDSGNGTLADPRLTVRSGETKVHSDDDGQGRNARAIIKVGDGGFNPGDIRIEIEADTTGSYRVSVNEVSSNHIWHAHMRPATGSSRHEGYCRAFSTRTVTVTEEETPKQREVPSGGCAIDTTFDPFGIISNNRIALAGTDYDIVALLHDSIFQSVDFATEQGIPTSQLTNVVLTIQGIEFSFSDADRYTTIVDGTDRYYHDWDSDQPPWTMGNRLHDWVLVELSTKP